MDIIKFDPTVEKLNALIAETSKITAIDLSDDTQIALVKQYRIELRDHRVAIEKKGKSLREDAIKYQKNVLTEERSLISIIDPEEKRLKAIEEEAALIKERAAREALLPMRNEQLIALGVILSNEEILDMDNDEFIVYLNEATTAKNERDRLEIEAEKAKLARAAELAAAAEDARVAERARIEANQKAQENARIEAAAQAKHDAEIAAQKLIDDARAEAERVASEKAAEAQKIVDDARAEAAKIVEAVPSTVVPATVDVSQVEKPTPTLPENSLSEDAVLLRNRVESRQHTRDEDTLEVVGRVLTYMDLIIPLLDELDGSAI